MKKFYFVVFLLIVLSNINFAQSIQTVNLSTGNGLEVASYLIDGKTISLKQPLPLFSFELNDTLINSSSANVNIVGKEVHFTFPQGVKGILIPEEKFSPGWKAHLVLTNGRKEIVKISNLVPLGQSRERIYIASSEPWNLASSKLFRPGLGPVGIVLPDNAWHLGFCAAEVDSQKSICAIARRTNSKDAEVRRYSTKLNHGGIVEYDIYADQYFGDWHNGLKMMFQERYLYDLEKFDNKLFERDDLKWIRSSYVIALQAGWDHEYYEKDDSKYKFQDYLAEGQKLFGGWDVFAIWPTWPTLGLDQRNQWDLYADLPGGLNKMKELSGLAKKIGTKFFISFNPWDKSTRQENFYTGMARLIRATDAEGVVLDTYGSSSDTLQMAADGVKPGVIMYSEGMAVPKDMPGIVAGRVHDAIFLPPPVNMNKFIKPDFAIFRVCQLREGRIHREIAISFFNGYGVEMNTFGPGRPDWKEEEYLYLGRTTKILRENTSAFNSKNWLPLITTLKDSIWVNSWPSDNKTIYTIFSLKPEGYDGPLFETSLSSNNHFVDLYHHVELKIDTIKGKYYLPVNVQAFDKSALGTRMEGNVDCIAQFPKLLQVKLKRDSLFIWANTGKKILVWAGIPSYQNTPKEFSIGSYQLKLRDLFGRYEGKFVIQLFDEKEILDEGVVEIIPGTPRLVSKVDRTIPTNKIPSGMIEISAGEFNFKVDANDSFVPYPDFTKPEKVFIKKFFMDKYPVTNKLFYEFVSDSKYKPADTNNYLKHWKNGLYLKEEENYPVVNISLSDAKAYTKWAGKRLPTEIEWQYAAQGSDERKWPWGKDFDSTKCNNALGNPTNVDSFPNGKSPFGVMDLVGNVWQLTNDVYDNDSEYFAIIRGGSYYKPTSSWWYVNGGPQQVNHSQMLLMVSDGFERNATVGFRCVKDIE
ncbi:MAG: formylglycine-generating enzyme family protein [Ignavibacteriales bacterium]|nr:formylglycine-generating enzyme family protein [Ignavibacteriales bacterium]